MTSEERALRNDGFVKVEAHTLQVDDVVAYVETDMWTGCRRGDVKRATVRSVNDDDGLLYVEHSGGSTEIDVYDEVWVQRSRGRCAMCGDLFGPNDTIAEMYDPKADDDVDSVLCHYEEGADIGLEIA